MTLTNISLKDIQWERMKPLPFLIVGFVLLLMLTVSLLLLVERAQSDSARALSTMSRLDKLSDVVTNVRRAESSQRGFLISQDPIYLEDFEPATARVATLLEDMHKIWTSSNEAWPAVESLSQAAQQKIAELRKTVAIAKAGDHEAAIARLKENAGLRLMKQIEADAAALIASERASYEHQTATSKFVGQIITGAGILAMILTLSIAALSILTLQHSLTEMKVTHSAMQQLNASLEQLVTERTRNLIEANQEIQNFASTVSHDLRAPLVNIMGFAAEIDRLKKELLERLAASHGDTGAGANSDIELGDEIDEALGFIKTSTGRMDKLINAILAITREGRRNLKPEPIDMTALIESLAETHAHSTQQLGLEIAVENLPPVTSDRLALEQIFGNLLDNAVKFLQPNVAGRIRVTGRSTPNNLIYEVADNGRGIDPKDRARVFAPFRRAGILDRPGDGVGLAHVRSLTRLIGGAVHFHSRLGEGATFIVELPRQFAHPERESIDG